MDTSEPPADLPVDPRDVVQRLERRVADRDGPAVGEAAGPDAPAGDGAPSVPGAPEPPD
jgi:hypothetical protein